MNPFPIVGYHDSEYFCDREQETKDLVSAIKNNRPVNLTSIRRIGKSALIKHVFHQLPKTYRSIFIDLEGTDTKQGFIKKFTNEISRQLITLNKGMLKKLLDWAAGFGASISLDSLDGSPKLELSHNQSPAIETLDGLMRLMQEHPKYTFVLAIDEFQEVTKYDTANVEGWVRAKMQEFQNVRFIFCGSEQTLMQTIFDNPSKPFYQITQPMHLGYIEPEKYKPFIHDHFGGKVSQDDILEILAWCRNYTYYVQYFCNHLFSLRESGEYTSLEQVKRLILESHKHHFLAQRKLITPIHWKLLKAIAAHQEIKNITSKNFVQRSGMAATSIRRSVQVLLEKDVLMEENGVIKIYNVFFQRYLETLI
ncbi:MAG: ATP-binding protein [Cytophagales bacterium]|nr:ATP-binding protein [Cytophagales bacterium]